MQGLCCSRFIQARPQQTCCVTQFRHGPLLAIAHSNSPAREADYELARQAVLQQWQTHRKRGKRNPSPQQELPPTSSTASQSAQDLAAALTKEGPSEQQENARDTGSVQQPAPMVSPDNNPPGSQKIVPAVNTSINMATARQGDVITGDRSVSVQTLELTVPTTGDVPANQSTRLKGKRKTTATTGSLKGLDHVPYNQSSGTSKQTEQHGEQHLDTHPIAESLPATVDDSNVGNSRPSAGSNSTPKSKARGNSNKTAKQRNIKAPPSSLSEPGTIPSDPASLPTDPSRSQPDGLQSMQPEVEHAAQAKPRKLTKFQQKQAAKAVRMRIKIARHRRSVWSLVRRLQTGSDATKRLLSSSASDASTSSTAGLRHPALRPDLVLLLKLSRYRPQGLQDTRAQVVVVTSEARVWNKVMRALQNKEALQSLSLQQLCFITAALAALQHPCHVSCFQQLCQAILPKLAASVKSLAAELDQVQSNADNKSPVLSNSSFLSGAHQSAQPPVTRKLSITAAPNPQSSAYSNNAGETANAQQASQASGISLGLYPASCLAVGLLRIQLIERSRLSSIRTRRPGNSPSQQQEGSDENASIQTSVHQTNVEEPPGFVSAANHGVDDIKHNTSTDNELSEYRLVVQQVTKLLSQWLQVALKLHQLTPNKSRHNATWFSHMVWCLTVLPARYHTPSNHLLSSHPIMPLPQALHASLAHRVTSVVLAKKGQLARLLDANAALRLATALASTGTYSYQALSSGPASKGAIQLGEVQAPTDTTVTDHDDEGNMQSNQQELLASKRTSATLRTQQQQLLSELQRSSATIPRSQNSWEAAVVVDPSKQLAIKLLVKQAHAQCGMLTPEGLAQLMCQIAASPTAVVVEAYTASVSGTLARGSVSLMQRLSKLLRARMHIIKLRELVTIITCFACLMKRSSQLGSSVQVLPDHLLLDELARWAVNKLQNASPAEAAQLVSSLAVMRWYNEFWWGKAGRYLMRVSSANNGLAIQHIQHVLTSFAIVGHTPRSLMSHITLLLLEKNLFIDSSDTNNASKPQSQQISSTVAADILASYIQLNCFNKELFEMLGNLIPEGSIQGTQQMHSNVSADANGTAHTPVQPDVICYLAAGCASLGYLPSRLANAAVEAAVQLQSHASNRRSSAITQRCIIGLASVTYVVYVSGHGDSGPLAAAFLDVLAAASDKDVAAAMASSKAVGAALLVCALKVMKEQERDKMAEDLHTKLQQTSLARMKLYGAAVKQYWNGSSLLGRCNIAHTHVANHADIGKQVCETFAVLNATGIMQQRLPDDSTIKGIPTKHKPALMLNNVVPDVCCSMRLSKKLNDVAVVNEKGAGVSVAFDRTVCLNIRKNPYCVGSTESSLHEAEYSDIMLRNEVLMHRVADKPVVMVYLDVDSWIRGQDLNARIACIKEAVWNAGWQV